MRVPVVVVSTLPGNRRRPEMEAAHDGVDFIDARNFHRLPHRIDDPDMAARADDDQAFAL
jgi:hypothetical protein